MIDLVAKIRAFIIADSTITNPLSTYNSAKAVFSRRPVPENVAYPLILISPQITSTENDFIDRLVRTATYDIAVYGQNDTAASYRATEAIAFALQSKFARLTSYDFEMPTGWRLVQATATGPIPFPEDDLTKVARGVTVTFTMHEDQS
jgi:hypothetical protein